MSLPERKVTMVRPDAEYLYERAMNGQGKDAPDKVLEYFDRAIAMDPGYVTALNEKANFLDQIGKLDEALTCYDRALTLDPWSAEAWFNKGLTLKKLGKEKDAEACINRGIELAVG
jgi:tetratricopeptide (TPR) repeat protein